MITVAELGQTEVVLLKQIIAAYGLVPSGDTEVPCLQQIATDVCGVSTANVGQTEVPCLSQIANFYGIPTTSLGGNEVSLLKQIVLNLPGTAYTTSNVGETEVPCLQQWLLVIANGTPSDIQGEYLTPDGLQYYVNPSGARYYQQP